MPKKQTPAGPKRTAEKHSRVLVGCYALAILLVVLDQYTKSLAEATLTGVGSIYVTPLLNWTLSYNTGAAFSLFSQFDGWQRWFLSSVSLMVSIVLVIWIKQQERVLSALAMTFILGGAVGNLIDRLATGAVVDFISVHYQQYYFAIFNVADAAVSIGAILLLIDWFFFENREPEKKDDEKKVEKKIGEKTDA